MLFRADQIFSRLDCDYVKTELVLSVLGRRQFTVHGRRQITVNEPAELAQQRTTLLTTRWCTPEFILRSLAMYFRRCAETALRQVLSDADVKPEACRKAILSLREWLGRWQSIERAHDTATAGLGDLMFVPSDLDDVDMRAHARQWTHRASQRIAPLGDGLEAQSQSRPRNSRAHRATVVPGRARRDAHHQVGARGLKVAGPGGLAPWADRPVPAPADQPGRPGAGGVDARALESGKGDVLAALFSRGATVADKSLVRQALADAIESCCLSMLALCMFHPCYIHQNEGRQALGEILSRGAAVEGAAVTPEST